MPALMANMSREIAYVEYLPYCFKWKMFKSVRQFRVVKLSTHMSVKYYCNNNADLRDCETHIQIAVIKNYKSTALKLNF